MATMSNIRRARVRSPSRQSIFTRTRKLRLSRLPGIKRRHQKHDPVALASIDLGSWIRDDADSRIKWMWGNTHPPAPELDVLTPRWAMILTCPPSFIDLDERYECEMLMGLAPVGAPNPAWKAIQALAETLFKAQAKKAGCNDTMSFYPNMGPKQRGPEPHSHPPHPLSARLTDLVPGYRGGLKSSYRHGRLCDLFDPRRAERRRGKHAPPHWTESYGTLAKSFWASGLSLNQESRARFDGWWATIDSLATAMRAHGMACWLCPGFFRRFPEAMDHMDALATIESDVLDYPRSTWVIGGVLNSPPSSAPTKGMRQAL